MRATDICGHVRTDMTWDVHPMHNSDRRNAVPEFVKEVDDVMLRLRPDYDHFPERHHRLHAGHLCETRADGTKGGLPKGLKSVDVRWERSLVETYEGPIHKYRTETITLDGTPVRVERALSILDRYPTVIEEVPDEVPETTGKKRR